MLTVVLLVALAAFVAACVAAAGKGPLWLAVVLLSIAVLLQFIPLR